ncbi:hypothetical protein J2S00_001503 [Caldalkalibacillus uzonensis]|uniref:Uncharacterized protein n=1 Tax=Caldalkalibacillus uzonensis TaxID=353224 RepID=A0ABU0CUM6_9BACI|nr:hypothetical protein [Caldalkalibacillus uzonensis]MDQ0338717.1 hypothetical protein [Caldalkalibacillus uzonensis]
MDLKLSSEEVISHIRQLHQKGQPLNKKKVKRDYPDLMKSALYYYPSWEHALKEADVNL